MIKFPLPERRKHRQGAELAFMSQSTPTSFPVCTATKVRWSWLLPASNLSGLIKLSTCLLRGGCLSIIEWASYTGCSAKIYPIFVLFISPVKIEIFQVCLFHIIGNFVFHPNFFFLNIYWIMSAQWEVEWIGVNYACTKELLKWHYWFFFLYFQFSKQGYSIPTIKQKMNSNKHKLSFNLNQPLVSFNMTSVPLKTSISSIHQSTNCSPDHFSIKHFFTNVWNTYSHMRMWDTILFFGWKTKFPKIWNKQTWNIWILTGDINNTKIGYIFAEHPVYSSFIGSWIIFQILPLDDKSCINC